MGRQVGLIVHGPVHRVHRGVRSAGSRRCAGHNAAILDGSRRRGDAAAIHAGSTKIAGAGGCSMNAVGGHLRASQGGFGQMLSAAVHGLPVDERAVRGGGHRVNVMRIGVVEIAIPAAVEAVVKESIVDVDVVPVAVAAVVPRLEGFAPAEREPAEAGAPAKPNAETHTKTGAKPADIGRSIIWSGPNRPRAPTPVATEIVPAAIMKGSETPRSIVDPRPAPRADVRPVAVTVRSPVGRNIVGNPNVAVGAFFFPGAVVVEIAVADGVTVDVLPRNGIVVLQVTVLGPTVEIIGFVSCGCGHLDVALVAGHVHAEGAGFANRESEIGSVNLIVLSLAKFTDTEIEFTFGETHLRNILIEVEERDRGHTAEMESGLAGFEFGARGVINPKLVANRHGPILRSGAPITTATWLDRDRTFNNADAGDTRRRIMTVIRRDIVVAGRRTRRRHIGDIFLSLSPKYGSAQEEKRGRRQKESDAFRKQCGLHNLYSPEEAQKLGNWASETYRLV